jgi:hypothetical protein
LATLIAVVLLNMGRWSRISTDCSMAKSAPPCLVPSNHVAVLEGVRGVVLSDRIHGGDR